MKCDKCLNSLPIISENRIGYICCLSNAAVKKCITGKKDAFIMNPMVKEGECDGR